MTEIHDLPDRKTLMQSSQRIGVLLLENRELLEIPDDVVGVIRASVLGQPPRLRQ